MTRRCGQVQRRTAHWALCAVLFLRKADDICVAAYRNSVRCDDGSAVTMAQAAPYFRTSGWRMVSRAGGVPERPGPRTRDRGPTKTARRVGCRGPGSLSRKTNTRFRLLFRGAAGSRSNAAVSSHRSSSLSPTSPAADVAMRAVSVTRRISRAAGRERGEARVASCCRAGRQGRHAGLRSACR